MKKLKAITITFFFILLVSLNTSAQESSASLQETAEFIGRVIADTSTFGYVDRPSKTKVNGCTINVESHAPSELITLKKGILFSLADIDPFSITRKDVTVSFESSGLKNVFKKYLSHDPNGNTPKERQKNADKAKMSKYDEEELTNKYSLAILVSNTAERGKSYRPINEIDIELAARFEKALKHGVKLCNGKINPF